MQAIRFAQPLPRALIEKEWLETFLDGGYAASSLCFANTRRYHGMYVAGATNLEERQVLLSRLDEEIFLGDEAYPLCTRQYCAAIVPDARTSIYEFEQGLYPSWTFVLRDAQGKLIAAIRKSLLALRDDSALLLRYDLLDGPDELVMTMRPFVAGRGIHRLPSEALPALIPTFEEITAQHSRLTLEFPNSERLFLLGNFHDFLPSLETYYDFSYTGDAERGFDSKEHLLTPGLLHLTLQRGKSERLLIARSSRNDEYMRAPLADREQQEILRRKTLLQIVNTEHPRLQHFLLAGERFICRPFAQAAPQIVAGFPWFGVWGRDSMIALPGLLLVPKQYEEARELLSCWISELRGGLLPNRMLGDEAPTDAQADLGSHGGSQGREYNTVDASLFLFVALWRYVQSSGDKKYIDEKLCAKLLEALGAMTDCPHFGIFEDQADNLLSAGKDNWQLTWMDARLAGVPVTARHGKAVEINALWYNAHCILAEFFEMAGNQKSATELRRKAEQIRKSFVLKFSHTENGHFAYLADYLGQDGAKNLDFRPNQLFALSLPFPLLESLEGRTLIREVYERLFTARGLRTLDPANPSFRGKYQGGVPERDSAYHQGTAWTWLLGPYFRAMRRFADPDLRSRAREQFEQCLDMLEDGCIGQIAEIYDGDQPFEPRGCFAQAWSVAELFDVAKNELGLALELSQVAHAVQGKVWLQRLFGR